MIINPIDNGYRYCKHNVAWNTHQDDSHYFRSQLDVFLLYRDFVMQPITGTRFENKLQELQRNALSVSW